MEKMLDELDELCARSRKEDTPVDLIHLHTHIAGIRHALGKMVVDAELDVKRSEERYDTHCMKTRLMLMVQDGKLSHAKAKDQVESEASTEQMRLDVIEKTAKYQRGRMALNTSNDVLISLAIRLNMLKQELIESRTSNF
jgi:hypothetical protein